MAPLKVWGDFNGELSYASNTLLVILQKKAKGHFENQNYMETAEKSELMETAPIY
jgi:hypothetical protein